MRANPVDLPGWSTSTTVCYAEDRWLLTCSTPASPPSARPTSGRSSPRCTTALPTESSGSRPTSEAASPPDSPSSTTQWTLLRSSSPSSDSSDRELLRLRPRPAESRRRKERTEPRRSVVLPRPRLELARSKQHSKPDHLLNTRTWSVWLLLCFCYLPGNYYLMKVPGNKS